MTIGRKIIGGYAIMLVLLALVILIALYSLARIRATYDGFIDVDERLMLSATELQSVAQAQTVYYRGLLLYPELQQENQDLLQSNYRKFGQVFETMRRLVKTTEGLNLVNEMAALQERLEQAYRGGIQLMLDKKARRSDGGGYKEYPPSHQGADRESRLLR